MKEKLKAFFMSDLGVDGDVLQFDTPLFGEEIGLDSVDSLEIISFVDSNFGVSMTGVAKENFQSTHCPKELSGPSMSEASGCSVLQDSCTQ